MNHSSRHSVVAAMLAAGLVTVLAGCSTETGEPAAEGDQVITLGTDDTVRIQPVIDAFEQANPGVKIEVQSGGNSYQEFLRTRLASKTAPDVLRTFPGAGNVAGVLSLDSAGALEDLSGQSWVGELTPQQLNLFGTADDRVLSVPVGALALGPVYNDQTLEGLGASVPTTLDEVLQLCDAAAEQNKVAFAIFQKGGGVVPTYSMVAPLVYGPEPDFTERQLAGEVSFTDSGWTKAYAIQQQMLDRGCFQDGPNGTDYNAAAALVANGDAVATFAFSDTTGLEDISPEGTTYTIAPFPTSDNPEDRYLAVADSNGFGVNADAKQKELALKFVEFIGTPKAQILFANAAKGAPALPTEQFQPEGTNQKVIAEYQLAGKTAAWPDQEWPGAEVVQSVDQVVQRLFNGEDTPQTATQKMDDAFKAAADAR
ncbi:extracellular solute-binding protein [Microbacterium sp. KSW4-11]|uniref:Extracellular solute-binding protein n=1 Tax=Microbacterium gawkjiense TaxID=3067309 RepID=A0ABU3GHI8_9MICO|nr:extracellular solute-binding protein [Microbacterium sp. KSW4-11]MDT3318135.1 extracellular solute-binding protein [Microbacterium sp. KSW4-11]